jgi:hypothetical protein
MKLALTLPILFLFCTAFSQDTIVTFRGQQYPATIVLKTGDSIRYKRSDYKESKDYTIDKRTVWKIVHKDGSFEDFYTEEERAVSLEDQKQRVVNLINLYGYEEDSDKEKYLATFEQDYLRMAIIKNDKVKSKGFLFDFGKVDQFHPVSYRGEDNAFINIYVDFLYKPHVPARTKWRKQKLIMKVKGHKNADDIMRSLQYLNKLLVDKK